MNFCGAIVDHFLQFWLDFTTTTRRENAFVFEMLSCYIVIVLLLLPACLHYRSALQCHIFAGCVIFIVKEHWESILWYVYDYDSQSAHHKVGRFKVFQVYIFTTKRNISEGGIAKPIVNALNLPKYSYRPDYSIFKPKPHWNYVSTMYLLE